MQTRFSVTTGLPADEQIGRDGLALPGMGGEAGYFPLMG
jgi:hypothetical protein